MATMTKKNDMYRQTEGQWNNISCLFHTNYNMIKMIKTSNGDKGKKKKKVLFTKRHFKYFVNFKQL